MATLYRNIFASLIGLIIIGLSQTSQAKAEVVRISINPMVYSYLPIFLAIDKGYFKEQGLEIKLTTYKGSSTTQMPLLARGDLDITPMVMGPGMFNQHVQGFDLKIISSIAGSHPNWSDSSWILIRSDVWKKKKFRSLSDLKGLSVDGGPLGSPVNLLIREGLKVGGLSLSDVKYSEKFKSPPDWMAAFKNKAVDVLAAVEPIVTIMEAKGMGKRWKSYKDAVPWFQETYLAASPKFLKSNRPAAVKFLVGFLKGAKEVHATKGKWKPELLATIAKWSKLPQKLLAGIPGPAYVGYMGKIDTSAINKQQEIWHKLGVIKKKVAVSQIIDTTLIAAAKKKIGIE